MRKSDRIKPGKSGCNAASAGRAVSKPCTWNPASSSVSVVASRRSVSSSTSITCAISFIVIFLPAIQPQPYHSPALRLLFYFQIPAHVLHDVKGNRQPQPQPLTGLFGRHEGVGQHLSTLSAQTYAIVADG